MFADDFVGISDSKESLKSIIDVVHAYCNKWRLKANVAKSAVMVFSKDSEDHILKWGERILPKVNKYRLDAEPRHSTTRSYRGDASDQFRSVQTFNQNSSHKQRAVQFTLLYSVQRGRSVRPAVSRPESNARGTINLRPLRVN